MRLTICIITVFILGVNVDSSFGDLVTADTTGSDNFLDPDFYGVEFTSGSGFIESVSWDLSLVPGAFFDFDGVGSFMNATLPVLDLPLNGLDVTNILSFIIDGPQSPTLTISFEAMSFEAGDSFRFGADTDFLNGSPTPGGVFGEFGVSFNVVFENGAIATGSFVEINQNQSIAAVSAAVPEPGSSLLFAIAALTFTTRRSGSRRQR